MRAGALILACATIVSAQTPTRRATNVGALLAYPTFYVLRPIVLVGKVETLADGHVQVSDDSGAVRVIPKGGAPDGTDEVRGEFWDLGRMKPDDPRLGAYDLKATFGIDTQGAWPRPGEVTAIIATSIAPASAPLAPSIRAIVLSPSRYLDQRVTITGQYSGRNLTGDLPDAPARSRYDFVLRSADAAVWVANIRPKGKDFEFALDSRVDSGRWMQVSGTVHQARGLLWIDADAGSLALAKPQTETLAEDREPGVRVPAAPPPEVVFSAPTQEESDVSVNATVRIQFTRDLDPASLKGHIRPHYLAAESEERGELVTPLPEFTSNYSTTARVLELKFAKPFERFRTVKIDLLEGIVGTDKQPLAPWTLTFFVGT